MKVIKTQPNSYSLHLWATTFEHLYLLFSKRIYISISKWNNLFLHFYVTLNVISSSTCSWNNIPIYQSELRDNFRKSPLGLGASTPLFIIPTDFRDKLWVELGSGVVTGLSLFLDSNVDPASTKEVYPGTCLTWQNHELNTWLHRMI